MRTVAKDNGEAKKMVCPMDKDVPFQILYIRCVKKDSECKKSLGSDFMCCNQRCVRGVSAPVTEQEHQRKYYIIFQSIY